MNHIPNKAVVVFLSSSGLGGEEVWPKGCRAVALKALLLCRQAPLVLFHFHFISLNLIFLSIRGKSSSFITSISYLRFYLRSSWHSVSAHPSLLLDSHTENWGFPHWALPLREYTIWRCPTSHAPLLWKCLSHRNGLQQSPAITEWTGVDPSPKLDQSTSLS